MYPVQYPTHKLVLTRGDRAQDTPTKNTWWAPPAHVPRFGFEARLGVPASRPRHFFSLEWNPPYRSRLPGLLGEDALVALLLALVAGGVAAENTRELLVISLTFRELEFSETTSQDCASLFVRTGARGRFAPVQHPRSRHLDTPLDKNSLTVPYWSSQSRVSEKTSSRQLGE